MPPLLTFDAAQTWLANRTSVPTVLGSRQLALSPDFPAAAKAHSFFSAKVSEGHILEALRAEVTDLAAGTTDIASARARLKTFLGRQGLPIADIGWTDKPPVGLSPEDWAQAKQISNLGSTRRLDLILRQNAAMAHAIGRRQVSLDPDIAERWPNFRYIITDDGNERPEHRALDGLSLPKTDPFWHTHTPPWDYNCRCDIEDDDAPANGTQTPDGRILNPSTGQIVDTDLSPESGYTFDIDSALSVDPSTYDWSTITDTALGNSYQAEMAKILPTPASKKKPAPPAKPATVAEARREELREDMKRAGFKLDGEVARIPAPVLEKFPPPKMKRSKTAQYSAANKTIEMPTNPKDWHGVPSTFHHEYGHHLHHETLANSVIGTDPAFASAMKTDLAAWRKREKARLGPNYRQTYSKHGRCAEALAEHAKRAGFSTDEYFSMPVETQQRAAKYFDTIGGLTKGSDGWGHTQSYYKSYNRGASEVYANVYSAVVMDYPEITSAFPEITAFIKGNIGL